MNRFNSLKNVQQFNVQISKTNKKVKEKKTLSLQLYEKLTKYFEKVKSMQK